MRLLRPPAVPGWSPVPRQVRVQGLPADGETRRHAQTGSVGLAPYEGDSLSQSAQLSHHLSLLQCTTLQYINTLTVCCESLREIIEILSPIRADSVEGANGLKVTSSEEEFDWFSHLHCATGRKGGSSQLISRGVNWIEPLCIIRNTQR